MRGEYVDSGRGPRPNLHTMFEFEGETDDSVKFFVLAQNASVASVESSSVPCDEREATDRALRVLIIHAMTDVQCIKKGGWRSVTWRCE